MRIWINENIESHRNWIANFGLTDDDVVLDQNDDSYLSPKNHPTVEVDISNKSFQQTMPEYINPVTGEELGEQVVSINVEAHLGIYYFDNRQAVLNWISDILNTMPDHVEEPDGITDSIPDDFLPEIPDIYL